MSNVNNGADGLEPGSEMIDLIRSRMFGGHSPVGEDLWLGASVTGRWGIVVSLLADLPMETMCASRGGEV